MMKRNEEYLSLATQENRARYDAWKSGFSGDWSGLQQAFLRMTKEYLDAEEKKPLEANIDSHEAGGQFRIAFPYLTVRPDAALTDYMDRIMQTRKAYTDAVEYHGYVDCAEVHHEIETYIYFQDALYYYNLPGAKNAADSIVHVAHHVGSWVEGVPAWYDWSRHEFTSNWLGTKAVRNFPPHDYQEGNHFRFIEVALCAYRITGERRYLDVAVDYCSRWCDHIEKYQAEGGPIPCSILPENVEAKEMSRAGVFTETSYTVFYSTVADNTMYDIVSGLLDTYRLTGTDRFLKAAEAMMEQFWVNGRDGRPAIRFSKGEWRVQDGSGNNGGKLGPNHPAAYVTDSCFLARLALRYHGVTGEPKYKDRILAWAKACDEENNKGDQVMAPVFFAAHFYDGDTKWLERAYEELLKFGAVIEADDQFHQCAWSFTRQGGRFLMEYGFVPFTGDSDWATRGSLPQELIHHVTGGGTGLPEGVSFRIWHLEGKRYAYEAVNHGGNEAVWTISVPNRPYWSGMLTPEAEEIAREQSGLILAELSVEAGGSAAGTLEMP